MLERAKLCEEGKKWLVAMSWGCDEGIERKGETGNFWADGNTLYLDCSRGHVTVLQISLYFNM